MFPRATARRLSDDPPLPACAPRARPAAGGGCRLGADHDAVIRAEIRHCFFSLGSRRPVKKICWGGREAGPYWLAGIVATGAAPLTPVSAMENSSIMIPNVYLDWMSASAIQNHLSWYCTATKASLGCASVTRTCKGDRRALLARRCQSAAANMPTCGGREGHSVWSHPSGCPGLTVHARCTPSRASARDASNTHRRQRAANNGLCSGDEAVHAWDLESFAEFQADGADDYRQ